MTVEKNKFVNSTDLFMDSSLALSGFKCICQYLGIQVYDSLYLLQKQDYFEN